MCRYGVLNKLLSNIDSIMPITTLGCVVGTVINQILNMLCFKGAVSKQ